MTSLLSHASALMELPDLLLPDVLGRALLQVEKDLPEPTAQSRRLYQPRPDCDIVALPYRTSRKEYSAPQNAACESHCAQTVLLN